MSPDPEGKDTRSFGPAGRCGHVHHERRDWQRRHALRHFVGARLHRRLFLAMGGAIFATALITGLGMHISNAAGPWGADRAALEGFAARRFEEVWHSPERRTALTRDLAQTFHVSLSLEDETGHLLERIGGACEHPWYALEIGAGTARQGRVLVCASRHGGSARFRFLVILFSAALVLWLVSGLIARRLSRPLWQLARVTSQIGQGDLSARVRLGRHRMGEVGVLAHSINDMAERLEKQIGAQRELLALVSHEIRTPLARLRLVTELWREKFGADRLVDDAEREIFEIDDLTGQLLASSRLDFFKPELGRLHVAAACREALRRAGLAGELLAPTDDAQVILADPNLLARALSNLLRNAQAHGGQVTRLSVTTKREPAPKAEDPPEAGPPGAGPPEAARFVHIEVYDDGPGFASDDLVRAFETFVQGRPGGQTGAGGGLGLGLALVKRIAVSHGGRAWARNQQGSGAVVGFSVALADGSGVQVNRSST